MKHHPVMHHVFAAVSFFILIGMTTDALCANLIKWYPYEEGMALGKSDGKKTFISFYADWCQYCRKMEKQTFKDPSIVSFLNENFIAIRVDVERERRIAAQYQISPLPDTWFISENGEIIGNKPGYMTAKELLPVLYFIQTESFLSMSFPEFMNDFEGPGPR